MRNRPLAGFLPDQPCACREFTIDQDQVESFELRRSSFLAV
jgi:hypothetical protein